MRQGQKNWTVYILECCDGTYYTGVTNDLEARVACHNAGKGARYTRGRLPVKLLYQEPCEDRTIAQRREIAIKKLSRPQKELLLSERKRDSK